MKTAIEIQERLRAFETSIAAAFEQLKREGVDELAVQVFAKIREYKMNKRRARRRRRSAK